MNNDKLLRLKRIGIDVRRDCIRVQKKVKSGHLGGAFSALEMMIYLYYEKMNIDPANPLKEDRDIFILSKGHASIGYYSILARRGYFPLEELMTYRKINSRLQGHSHIDDVPGVECSSGSLGQGISFGLGLALGYTKQNMKNKVYVMIGDGELEEGQNWEAILLQKHLNLNNLIIIVDKNNLQLDDNCMNVLSLDRLEDKFNSFGYNVITIDGNDFYDIDEGFQKFDKDKPNVIISNTVKGKGISFMENKVEWHAKKVNEEEYISALKELDKQEVELNG
ncbi:transketolase [Clostridium sediminicola]|uniref:transketolase n=1 Tax=Clostridium sediminicola TaxID=3114879 RepID=UPI0031F20620